MARYKIYRKYANVSKWGANMPIENWNAGKPLLVVEASCITDALSSASKVVHIGSGLLGAVKVDNYKVVYHVVRYLAGEKLVKSYTVAERDTREEAEQAIASLSTEYQANCTIETGDEYQMIVDDYIR